MATGAATAAGPPPLPELVPSALGAQPEAAPFCGAGRSWAHCWGETGTGSAHECAGVRERDGEQTGHIGRGDKARSGGTVLFNGVRFAPPPRSVPTWPHIAAPGSQAVRADLRKTWGDGLPASCGEPLELPTGQGRCPEPWPAPERAQEPSAPKTKGVTVVRGLLQRMGALAFGVKRAGKGPAGRKQGAWRNLPGPAAAHNLSRAALNNNNRLKFVRTKGGEERVPKGRWCCYKRARGRTFPRAPFEGVS